MRKRKAADETRSAACFLSKRFRRSALFGGKTLNLRAQGTQLIFQMLVAAVDEMDVVDVRHALGHQARDHQRRTCAQVGGRHRAAHELGHTLDDGDAIVDLRNAAHAANLFQMLKAHLKDRLVDEVPRAVDSSTLIGCCKSVGKPG